MTFAAGSTVVVREVLHDAVWATWREAVESDDGEILAAVLLEGTPMTFPEHPVPHPWGHLDAWQGTTVLKLRRAGEWYSVWKFFDGGRFTGWYVNFERPVVRTADGVDVDDLQLDIVIEPDGEWLWKDVHHLGPSLDAGRMDVDALHAVLGEAAVVADLLERDDRWWAPWDDWVLGPAYGRMES